MVTHQPVFQRSGLHKPTKHGSKAVLTAYISQSPLKTGDEIPKININLPDPSKPSDIFWVKAAQHTLPVGFAKSVEKVECFNDMIEILYVGEESEEMVLPCKISFTKDRFII